MIEVIKSTPEEIISLLLDKKIFIKLVDGDLSVKASKGKITQDIVNLIKDNKSSLVAYLRDDLTAEHDDGSVEIEALPRSPGFSALASHAQERMWVVDKLQGQSAIYNIPVQIKVSGDFDVDSAEKAIGAIMDRHEILRTNLVEAKGEILQVVRDSFEFSIKVKDLTAAVSVEMTEYVERTTAAELQNPFDLSLDLLLRAMFIKLPKENGRDQGLLLFVIHHAVTDGWSMEILCREFIENYQSVIDGQPDSREPLSVQYADYSHWQSRWLDSDEAKKQLDYWNDQLAELPPTHGLSLDKPRPRTKQHSGRTLQHRFSAGVVEKLNLLANDLELTPFMLLHGILALVLSRNSQSDDIVVGMPVANRPQHCLEDNIGLFFNTLVLRVNARQDSLLAFWEHVKQTHLDAQSNQSIPFEMLVEKLNHSRDLSINPLFQILLTVSSGAGVKPSMYELQNDISFAPETPIDTGVKFDLDIHLSLAEDVVDITWTYDTSLFECGTIKRLSEHFTRVVKSLVSFERGDTSKSIFDIEMLSDEERLQAIESLAGVEVEVEKQTVTELFERQAILRPNSPAVIFRESEISYRELSRRSNRLANYLIEQGVSAQTPVGLIFKRSIDLIIAMLAVAKAGALYVPIDPSLPGSRREFMIQDIGLNFILGNIQGLTSNAIDLSDNLTHDAIGACSSDSPTVADGVVAYIIYTSGSTGKPKGVVIPHAGLTNFIVSMNRRFANCLTPGARSLATTTYCFDVCAFEIYSPLTSGGTVVMATDAESLDADEIAKLIERHSVSMFQTTPAKWQMLIDRGWPGRSGLTAVSCGEALPQSLAESLLRKSDKLFDCYGPTEASVYSLVSEVNEESLKSEGITLGNPLDNYRHLVLTGNRQLTPDGVAGELYIGGVGLASSYFNRPDLTRERFVEINVLPLGSHTFYRTGDLVRRLANGRLEFLGRIDNQVKLNGLRIELGEIEYQINSVLEVQSSLVTLYDSGRGDKRILAFVVPELSHEKDPSVINERIRAALKEQLPYYMVPWDFVFLNDWPLNANGKIDRKKLPTPSGPGEREYIQPETETQVKVAEVWSGLLGLSPDKIGLSDNFFELGGHSILAIKLVHSLNQAFDLSNESLSISDIFEAPHLQALSDNLELFEIRKRNHYQKQNIEDMEFAEEGEI